MEPSIGFSCNNLEVCKTGWQSGMHFFNGHFVVHDTFLIHSAAKSTTEAQFRNFLICVNFFVQVFRLVFLGGCMLPAVDWLIIWQRVMTFGIS